MASNRLLPGAQKIVRECLSLQAGECFLVVADHPNETVAQALAEAGGSKQAEIVTMLMSPRQAHGEDPPAPVARALQAADAAVLATVFSLSNSAARIQACKRGTRLISIPGCQESVLTSGAIEADFLELKPKIEEMGRLLSAARIVHIGSASGTDLTVKLAGRPSVDQTCTAHDPGSWSPFPIVETAVGPDAEGADGVLMVDGATIPGGPVKEPIQVRFERGKIVEFRGGDEARTLEQRFREVNHPNIYQLVELGLGLNPKARIGRGKMAEDESQFGTAHVGLGVGHTFGLEVSAPAHFDLVVKQAEVSLDGTPLLSDGTYQIGPFKGMSLGSF